MNGIIKILFFLILGMMMLSFHSSDLSAQNSANVKIGSAFVNRAISDNQADTVGRMDGWHIGVDARIGPYGYYLSPGIHLYWFQVVEGNSFLAYGDPRYYTLKVPLNMGYCVNMGRKFSFRFSVGANVNYVFHVDENEAGINFSTINDLFLGVNAGGGIDYGRFTFDIVYENGLTNVVKIPDERKFNYLSVTVGWLF